MNVKYMHALTLLLIGFLALAPTSAAATGYAIAEDPFNPGDLLNQFLTYGAEVVFASIDSQGVPGVLYGQLGTPSEELGLSQEMYQGCVAMALVSTHGEFLDLIFELVGISDMFGGDDGGGEFALAQDGMPFDVNSILDMIGTEFNLLINVFLNVDQATSVARMGSIKADLSTRFGFDFAELFALRIDENTFPPDSGIALPFESIDVYINTELHDFATAVSSYFQVMDDTGILGAVDQTSFTGATAAAAGLIAIPDMDLVMDIVGGLFGGGDDGGDFLPSSIYEIAQLPSLNITGPLAIVAAGYLGDQEISSDDSSVNIGDLFGATGTISPLTDGLSIIIASLPEEVNITSYTPDTEGFSFHDEDSSTVIWNSSGLGGQSDYILYFDEGVFPPDISIERTFSPESGLITAGGSVEVTVTVTNEGTEPITNVQIDDSGISGIYATISVSGTTTATVASLAGGDSTSITYTVTFTNEGGYTFPKALLSYTFEGITYSKDTPRDGYTVGPNIAGLLTDLIADGWPYTGVALGFVGLVGVYSILGLVRGRGDSGGFTV